MGEREGNAQAKTTESGDVDGCRAAGAAAAAAPRPQENRCVLRGIITLIIVIVIVVVAPAVCDCATRRRKEEAEASAAIVDLGVSAMFFWIAECRDMYGFALRPQHLKQYREHARIYKVCVLVSVFFCLFVCFFFFFLVPLWLFLSFSQL